MFGDGRVNVKDERLNVGPQLGDDEPDALRHKPGDESYVSAQPVQFRDDDGALEAAGLGEGGGELWAALKSVGTLASLNLDMLGDDLEALDGGETGNGLALSLKAEAALALLCGADPDVGNQQCHGMLLRL